MTPLLAAYWPALAAALALGVATGLLAGWPETPLARRGGFALAGLAGLLVASALIGWAPGRAGLWLEAAALVLVAYLAGWLPAARLRGARADQDDRAAS